MKGLGWQRTSEAIAAFVREHGHATPRRAVLCTYDFHPARFHAVVLPELTRSRRWFRTLVLADAGALQQPASIAMGGASAAGAYELAPVRLAGPGVFHPKLVLIQAGEHVLVGIGSANLTPGGLGGNLELMRFQGNRHAAGRDVAASALQFLHDLGRAQGIQLPGSAKQFLDRVCASLPRRPGGPLLHSLTHPLLDQMERGRPAGVRKLTVVSPWHSSHASPQGVEPKVITALAGGFQTTLEVYTEGQRGSGPGLGASASVHVLRQDASLDDDEVAAAAESSEADEVRKRSTAQRRSRLHAKAYLAEGARRATLWFGSANCTAPALLRAASKNGNVELLVRTDVDRAAVAALRHDLAELFEPAKGPPLPPPADKTPIPQPNGVILCGRVNRRAGVAVLDLELAAPTRRLRVAASRTARPVAVEPGDTAARLAGPALARLLDHDGQVPGVLWEVTSGGPIPFPVSVPLIQVTDSAEGALGDALDELAGRAPRSSARGGSISPRDDAGDDEADDPELALLTKTEHQGALDRLAVRVALLARRLRATGGNGHETIEHYRRIVRHLPLAPWLRDILVAHLDHRTRSKS